MALIQFEGRPDIVVPASVSKSVAKSMGCEVYFAAYYLTADAAVRRIESAAAKTGTDFHRYRAEYVDYLTGAGKARDEEWGREWLASNGVTPDARKLIEDDLRIFEVDPDAVFGTEVFLSVDHAFNPLELRYGGTPGMLSSDEQALASGSIDRLEIRGRAARVVDCKSGWSTVTVSDYEPPNYAALVMAHFPNVDEVSFEWEFARVHCSKEARYTREDLPWIHEMVRGEWERKNDIARRFAAGEKLAINPWAGLCGFCALRCPLRSSVEQGNLIIPPVQTDDDARAAAAILFQAEILAGQARAALKPFLDAQPDGRFELSQDFVLESTLTTSTKFPLLAALEVLGALPTDQYGQPLRVSPRFQVPLENLYVSSTELKRYAGAKKRAGCLDELVERAKKTPRSGVRIRRLSEGEGLAIDAGEEAA